MSEYEKITVDNLKYYAKEVSEVCNDLVEEIEGSNNVYQVISIIGYLEGQLLGLREGIERYENMFDTVEHKPVTHEVDGKAIGRITEGFDR